MPFKSAKQRKYLYSQKPEVAKKFAKHSKPKKKKQLDVDILQALLVQGGLGTTAAVFIWLYLQEKNDRKASEGDNKLLRDQYAKHLEQDIDDKIADRDALNQAIAFVKESKNVR